MPIRKNIYYLTGSMRLCSPSRLHTLSLYPAWRLYSFQTKYALSSVSVLFYSHCASWLQPWTARFAAAIFNKFKFQCHCRETQNWINLLEDTKPMTIVFHCIQIISGLHHFYQPCQSRKIRITILLCDSDCSWVETVQWKFDFPSKFEISQNITDTNLYI